MGKRECVPECQRCDSKGTIQDCAACDTSTCVHNHADGHPTNKATAALDFIADNFKPVALDAIHEDEDEGPDVDLINDTERDMRMMREADVAAGRLCSTCERSPPAAGFKVCITCLSEVDES